MGYPNWDLGSGMANGIKEGLIAYQTNKQIQRQNQMQDLLSGVQHDPDTGAASLTPLKKQQMDLEQQHTQRGLLNLDPNSPVSAAKRQLYTQTTGKEAPDTLAGADIDESMKMIAPSVTGYYKNSFGEGSNEAKIKAAEISAKGRVEAAGKGLGLREDSLNERVHNLQLKTINNDQTLNQLQTSHNNLANAIQLFQQGGATPQEFHELQQAVRGNLGMKGGSGVGERESTYLKSLGISADSVKQFLTGNPQSVIESDPKFAEQIVNLAKMEMKNKETMAGAQLDRLKNGRSSFYQKPGNEGRSQDMENTINARKAQFGLIDPNAQNAAAPQSPSGGLLGGQQKAPMTPQDTAAVDWAMKNKSDPRAQTILKSHGY